MKLDQESLADSPILARLVTDAAVGRAGALELLSDDYKPPQPPMLHVAHDEAEASDEDEPEPAAAPESADAKVLDVERNPNDSAKFPDMVAVPPVRQAPLPSSTTQGVRLIRPRTLADMQHTS